MNSFQKNQRSAGFLGCYRLEHKEKNTKPSCLDLHEGKIALNTGGLSPP